MFSVSFYRVIKYTNAEVLCFLQTAILNMPKVVIRCDYYNKLYPVTSVQLLGFISVWGSLPSVHSHCDPHGNLCVWDVEENGHDRSQVRCLPLPLPAVQSSASHAATMPQMKRWWGGQAWSDSKTLLQQGEGKWPVTSSDSREKEPPTQQCTGCQKTAQERGGGRRRHSEAPSKKTWKTWVLAGMEPARSPVTVRDAPRGTGGPKSPKEVRYFSMHRPCDPPSTWQVCANNRMVSLKARPH